MNSKYCFMLGSSLQERRLYRVARRPGSFPVGDRIHAATSLQVVVSISKLGSQFSLQHFARRISREVRHEHKSTRNFVAAKLLPAERDTIFQRPCSRTPSTPTPPSLPSPAPCSL